LVRVRLQPASEQAPRDASTLAMRPAFQGPSQELKTSIAGIAITISKTRCELGRIVLRADTPLLVALKTAPERAEHEIDECDHLLPAQVANPRKLQASPHAVHRRTAKGATAENVAMCTLPRQSLHRSTSIVPWRGHTATQPRNHHNRKWGSKSSSRHCADREPSHAVLASNRHKSTADKALVIFILAVNWLPLCECHPAQSLDAYTGLVADPLEGPGIWTTPPMRVSGAVNAFVRKCRTVY
jgi:hypothetical protein